MEDQQLVVDSINIFSGVNSVEISVDRGSVGDRGGYIIIYLGNPNDITFPIIQDPNQGPVYPQTSDWYINMKTTDEDYMCVYQLKTSGVWELIFKLIPNVYRAIKNVSFTSGVGTTTVSVSANTLRLAQLYGSLDIPTTSESVDTEAEMLALDAIAGEYVFRTDLARFFKLSNNPATEITNWTPELGVNMKVDFQNANPVMSNFAVGKPTVTTVSGAKTYNFPITINAIELSLTTGLTPMSGSKPVHMSISVI